MNQCILMAEIIQSPELRYTSDTQTPVTEMMVQFPGLRADDPVATLKVIGWGNLAQEIQANYHRGDRVLIEGRLGMNVVDRPEGFKETRAELTAQRIHSLGADTPLEGPAEMPQVATTPKAEVAPKAKATAAAKSTSKSSAKAAPTSEEFDDIPF
jgi:single-stranded DNA-binding protein